MNNIKYLFLILLLTGCSRDFSPSNIKYTVIQGGQTYTNLNFISGNSVYSQLVDNKNKVIFFFGTYSIYQE